jgi:hypothetical protein
VAHILNPSYARDGKRILQSGWPWAWSTRPYLKNKFKQKDVGVAHVKEFLPSYHKALSSNSNTTQKMLLPSEKYISIPVPT